MSRATVHLLMPVVLLAVLDLWFYPSAHRDAFVNHFQLEGNDCRLNESPVTIHTLCLQFSTINRRCRRSHVNQASRLISDLVFVLNLTFFGISLETLSIVFTVLGMTKLQLADLVLN